MADRYDRFDRNDRDRYGRDDRGLVDRAGDEVRSWFGDEDAARRRAHDEREGRGSYSRNEEWSSRSEARDPRAWGDGEYRREPIRRDESWNRGSERPGDWAAGPSSQRSYGSVDYNRPSSDYGRGSSVYGASGFGSSGYGSSGSGSGYSSSDPDYDSVRAYREPDRSSPRRFGTAYGAHDIARTGADPMSMGGGYGGSSSAGSTPGRGQFSGRGPKGYRRSDERIREDVCDRLSDDPSVDATDIEITVSGGEVTLSGHVRDREDKRRAEDLVERISGVREVHNSLRVNRDVRGQSGGDYGDQNNRDAREQHPGDVIGLGSTTADSAQSNAAARGGTVTGKR